MKFDQTCYINGDNLRQIKTEIEASKTNDLAKSFNSSVEKTKENPHKITLSLEIEEDHAITNH